MSLLTGLPYTFVFMVCTITVLASHTEATSAMEKLADDGESASDVVVYGMVQDVFL